MSTSEDGFRAFEEALARYDEPREVGAALHRLFDAVVGVKLLTLTAIDMDAGVVRRVYSSHEDVYPLLGTKPLVADAWLENMRTERRIIAINSAAGMEGEFADLDLIRSLGCNASISLPAMAGGKLLGTLNALHAEGMYPPEKVEAAQALIVPAVVSFMILRAAFDL